LTGIASPVFVIVKDELPFVSHEPVMVILGAAYTRLAGELANNPTTSTRTCTIRMKIELEVPRVFASMLTSSFL